MILDSHRSSDVKGSFILFQEFGYQDDTVEWTSPFGVILCMLSFFLNSSFPFVYLGLKNTMATPALLKLSE